MQINDYNTVYRGEGGQSDYLPVPWVMKGCGG